MSMAPPAGAAERRNGKIVLRCWGVPTTSGNVNSLAEFKALEAFQEQFPHVEPIPSTGLEIQGKTQDMVPLMQIAGDIPADVMYVNFRQSQTYVSNRFLYPLDKYIEGVLGKKLEYGLDIQDGPFLPTGRYLDEAELAAYIAAGEDREKTYIAELQRPLSEAGWKKYRAAWLAEQGVGGPRGLTGEAAELYAGRFADYATYTRWYADTFDREIRQRVPKQCWAVMRRVSPYKSSEGVSHCEEWGLEYGPDRKVRHIWAFPEGPLVIALFYSRDLFNEAGLPDRAPETWEEFFEWSRLLTEPSENQFGAMLPINELSWSTLSFLYSMGGRLVDQDEEGNWYCTFDSDAAVDAYFFVARLFHEPFTTRKGDEVSSVVNPGDLVSGGQIRNGMWFAYLDQRSFRQIDTTTTNFGPVPKGPPIPGHPEGMRGAEFNSRMAGIYAGLEDDKPARDAAWEYIRYYDGPEANKIRAQVYVENGLARFVQPSRLRAAGYPEYIPQVPEEWDKVNKQALEYGVPEPYGRNCQMVYTYASKGINQITTDDEIKELIRRAAPHRQKLEELREQRSELRKSLQQEGLAAEDRELLQTQIAALDAQVQQAEDTVAGYNGQAKDRIREILQQRVAMSNEKMLNILSDEDRRIRTIVASLVAVAIVVIFFFVFWRVFKTFDAAQLKDPTAPKGKWQFTRYRWAYILMIPAVGSILLWLYYPLARGTIMAFQDYNVRGFSEWVGMQNFANVLWDREFWYSMYVSLKYATLFAIFGFTAPIVLAFLLTEVPRGTVLFRTIYYLPAVLTGLVTIFLWRSFYSPKGLLNQVINYGIEAWNFLDSIYLLVPLCLIAAGTVAWLLISTFRQMEEPRTLRVMPMVMFLIVALMSLLIGGGEMGYLWYAVAVAAGYAALTWLLKVESLTLLRAVPMAIVAGAFALVAVFGVMDLTGQAQWGNIELMSRSWLQSPNLALLCILMPVIWMGMGPGCLIYLAALKTIPEESYEAADIDGAGIISKALNVAVPGIKALILINFIGIMVATIKGGTSFALAMTGGGPYTPNGQTEFVGLHIWYQAFGYLRFGAATSMAWVLGSILVGFTVVQLQRLSRMEFKTASGVGG
jgi:multiple sugar transport system permease protein